jgi:hypothetical protein
MKHIKLFEDYSDEEIEGLLGDLETIGHKYRLIPGEDFGFGKSLQQNRKWYMKGRTDGSDELVIKKSVVDDMLKRGIMRREEPYAPGNVIFNRDVDLEIGLPREPTYRFNHFNMGNIAHDETDYVLTVNSHVFRLSAEEKVNEYKDFAQKIFDYLSSIRK